MPARATQNPKPETYELHPLGGNNAKFCLRQVPKINRTEKISQEWH
jgi:hypothetical protein